MDKKYLLLGVIVLALIGLAVVLQMNTVPMEDDMPVVTEPTTDAPESGEIVELEGDSLLDVASANPEFSTLVTAVEAAGLTEFLETPGSYTVLAPTNAAFDALPEGTLDDLLKPENVDQLIEILSYHLVIGTVPASDIVGLTEIPTLQDQVITVAVDGDTVRLNDSATVVQTDIEASNGIIHAIDAVLIPETNSAE